MAVSLNVKSQKTQTYDAIVVGTDGRLRADILTVAGDTLGSFCRFLDRDELYDTMWFDLPSGTPPPESVQPRAKSKTADDSKSI